MAVIRTWSGDGLSPTNLTTSTVGAGDTAFSSINGGGTFTVTADGTRSPQITWPSTSAAHNVRWNALGNLTAWAIRRYFSVASLPGVTWGILVGLNSGGGDLFRVEINSSGYLRYRSATAAVFSPSTTALEVGVVYRIELTGQADGSSTVALYEGDSTTALLSSTITVTAGNLDEIRFGHHSSMATSGETGDDFAVANTATFIGPVEEDDEPVPEIFRFLCRESFLEAAVNSSEQSATVQLHRPHSRGQLFTHTVILVIVGCHIVFVIGGVTIQCIGDLIGAVGKVGISDREHISVTLVNVPDERAKEYSLYGTGVLRHLTDGVDYLVH